MAARAENESALMNRTTLERESDREIVIRRSFDAPAGIVFGALTNPDLVRRWWAPRSLGVSVVSVEIDVRVGGKYRHVLRHDGGGDVGFSGEYLDIVPPRRLVYTQIYEPMAEAGEVVVTVSLDERDGRTHLVLHERWPSKGALDGALATNMERGFSETMDQLEQLVTSRA